MAGKLRKGFIAIMGGKPPDDDDEDEEVDEESVASQRNAAEQRYADGGFHPGRQAKIEAARAVRAAISDEEFADALEAFIEACGH